MISSDSNHSDTATRATEEQNGWHKPHVIRSIPTKSKLRSTRNHRQCRQLPAHLVTTTRSMAWQDTRFHKRQDSTTTAYEKVPHMSNQNPILLVGQAVACKRPGALVNKLESAWLEGVWLGRDSETDEHLIGTPNGTVRSLASKRRVERRCWESTLLNAMVWATWKPTPVTRGRQLKVRSDREPFLMGPIPIVQFNLPDDPDTATTATAAVPSQETTSREATQSALSRGRTQSAAEQTRVRPAPMEQQEQLSQFQ